MTELVDRVAKLLSSGDVTGAQALVATQDPANQALGLAVIALFANDPAAVIANAERAVGLGGGAPALHYLALGRLSAGQGDAAIDAARKAVALDTSTKSRANLGSVLLIAKRPKDAVAVLRQVASEDPTNFDVQLSLGLASAQVAEFGEAITSYAHAFEARPGDARPIQGLMMMFAEVGKWLGAMAALEMSRNGEPPPNVAITLDLVMVHLLRQIGGSFPQRAIAEDVDKAVDKLVSDAVKRAPGVQLVVARTLLDLGRLDDVGKLVERLDKISLAPAERANLVYIRGAVAERAGDRVAALAHYEEALDGDPERGDACANALAIVLADGSPAAFAKMDRLLATVSPQIRGSMPELLLNEAIYLVRSGRPNEAPPKFRRILDITGGEGRVAALARQALAELAAHAR